MARFRAVLLFTIVVATVTGDAWSEVTDEAGPPSQTMRRLSLEELKKLTASLTTYDLVDVATDQRGSIVFGQKTISVSWYFTIDSKRTYLTRKGVSCIVLVGSQQWTKCLTVSEDVHSGNCRYLVQELRDKRAACLRNLQAP